MTTTDTPRTDALFAETCNAGRFQGLCRQLEREITASKAEVERLREQLESTKLLALKFWKVLEENGFKIELPK
jgi:hypothetical protein